MTAKLAVVEQNRTSGDICPLQPCSHLARVKGVAVAIRIAGDDHRGRVGNARPDLMVRRILGECDEDRLRRCGSQLQPASRAQDDCKAASGKCLRTSYSARLQQVSRSFAGAAAERTD